MSYTQKQSYRQNNRKVGTSYEGLAQKYLIQVGYTILLMNYRCKNGEIDIIAKDNEYIVFIEVKYRRSNRYGYPSESVHYHKQKKLLATAKYYLYSHKLYGKSCRFDVLEILDDQINLIKNAFTER